jgi:hypothetical protein
LGVLRQVGHFRYLLGIFEIDIIFAKPPQVPY